MCPRSILVRSALFRQPREIRIEQAIAGNTSRGGVTGVVLESEVSLGSISDLIRPRASVEDRVN
jgi:hypothetical protein